MTFTEPKERAKAFGVFGAIAGGGAAIGLILGGVLTEYASWRWCLGVNVPFAILVAVLAVPFVHESKAPGDTALRRPRRGPRDVGLVSLVYGFTQGGQARAPREPDDPSVLGWTDSTTSSSSGWPSSCSSRSCSGSAEPATRCCRCASSPTATAAAPT